MNGLVWESLFAFKDPAMHVLSPQDSGAMSDCEYPQVNVPWERFLISEPTYRALEHYAANNGRQVEDLLYENFLPLLFGRRPAKSAAWRCVDLFAGIGGIRLGFEQAFGTDLRMVLTCEWDLAAQKTYRANFVDDFPIQGDITLLPEARVPPFDICLAGFPCQAFSLAGKRLGFEDDYKGMSRGTLFFEVARICERHRPRVIFCENVKGLVIHDKGRTFRVIKGRLREMGYKVHAAVLNSRDFGVPQNRERIYVVAFREDVDDATFAFPEPIRQKVCLRDILEREAVSSKYYLSTQYLKTLRLHRARHEAAGHGFGYEIRPLSGVANAIVCGGMGRERNLIVDTRLTDFTPQTRIKGEVNREGIRKMTPREWARLQGFPESFKLPLADASLYKQLGNSVTVPVIRAIAEKIKGVLGAQSQSW